MELYKDVYFSCMVCTSLAESYVENEKDLSQNDIMNKANRINSIWCFNEIEMSKANKGIKMNFYENVLRILKDPVFDSIKEHGDFKDIVNKLNSFKERGVSLG